MKKTINIFDRQQVQSELQSLYRNFAEIFSFEFLNEDCLDYLSSIERPTNQPCAKEVYEAWVCEECAENSNSIMCCECYERTKELHKFHKVVFKTSVSGCCDCGDPNFWSSDGTCLEHKSALSTQKEIDDYINSSFKETELLIIEHVLGEIFDIMNMYLINNPREKNKDETRHAHIIDGFLEFVYKITKANLALVHIISKFLVKNYPNETQHQCMYIKDNKVIIDKTTSQHKCLCPFIRVLYLAWTTNVQQKPSSYPLLKNFTLKITMGISFLSLFCTSLDIAYDTMFNLYSQVMTLELAEIVTNSEEFLLYFFDNFIIFLKTKIADNKSAIEKKLSLIVNCFHLTIQKLIRQTTVANLNKNINIHKRIVDILCLFNGFNPIKDNRMRLFIREGWKIENWLFESEILDGFCMLLSIYDYSNQKNIDELLVYVSNKIISQDYNTIKSDEYSFHIPIFRAFSALLVRYMFTYSHLNNCNLMVSLNYIIGKISKFDKLCEITIKEVLKCIGYIISIEKNYWVYYGEEMLSYSLNYFKIKTPRVYDFSLIKILMSLVDNAKYFTIDKILEYASVKQSSRDINNHVVLNPYIAQEELKWINTEDKLNKEMALNAKILYCVFNIVRDRKCLFDNYESVYWNITKNKTKFKTIMEIFLKEKDNIIQRTKQELINQIIALENSAQYSDLSNIYPDFLEPNYSKNEFNELIKSITNEVVLHNQEIRYSVKDEFLNLFDIGLLSSNNYIAKAENYIMEFKKNVINILNTHNIPSLSFEQELDLECFVNFFVPRMGGAKHKFFTFLNKNTDIKNNIDFILSFLLQLVENENFQQLSNIFLEPLSKMIIVFSNVTYNNPRFQSVNVNIYLIVSRLIPYNNLLKEKIAYLQDCVSKIYGMIEPQLNNKVSKEDLKNKKKHLMDKYKKKFKKKNDEIKNKYIDESKENNNNNNFQGETCVMCKNPIEFEDYNTNPFGKFCFIFFDSLLSKTIDIQCVKDYRKYNKSNTSYKQYKRLTDKKSNINNTYTTRFFSCNHYIHSSCFLKYKLTNMFSNETLDLKCPLCKLMTNSYIPELICIDDDKMKATATMDDMLNLDFANEIIDCSNIQNIINECKNFVEEFVMEKKQKSILVVDMNKEEEQEEYFDSIVSDFSYFFYLCQNIEQGDFKHQIQYMSNLLLALRVLIRSEYLTWFGMVKNIIYYFYNQNDGYNVFTPDNISDQMFFYTEVLIALVILVKKEFIKENVCSILNIALKDFSLNLYIKSLFIENNLQLSNEKLKAMLTHDNIKEFYENIDKHPKAKEDGLALLKEILLRFKLTIVFSNVTNFTPDYKYDNDFSLDTLLKEFHLDEYISNPLSIFINGTAKIQKEASESNKVNDNECLSSIHKVEEDFIDSIQPKEIEEENTNYIMNYDLLRSCIVPKLSFIPLPDTLIDLIRRYQKTPCYYCHKFNPSYVCLTCGRKMCSSISCFADTTKTKVSFLHHARNCTGGNCAFIYPNTGGVVFYTNTFTNQITIYIYKNKFGEKVTNGEVTPDFVLNREECEKVLRVFITYNYDKRVLIKQEYITELKRIRKDLNEDNDNDYEVLVNNSN